MLGLLVSGSLLLSACGFQTYTAKPIDPAQTLSRQQSADPEDEAFHQFLIAQSYPAADFPIRHWGLRELTFAAMFYHPQLSLARAQWRAAQSAEITAAQRPLPGLSGGVENHSETDGGASPWTYSLAIDLPIETAGKRQARIDRALSLSEAARIEIAQNAWQVRSRLASSWIEYNASRLQAAVLQQELTLRQQIVSMLDARFEAGMISSVERSNARLQLQRTEQALEAETNRAPELLAAVASNAGLPLALASQLPLDTANLDTLPGIDHQRKLQRTSGDDIQQAAMLNRLDLRAALARYAAAEAKLKLEIARQYPDIVLSPGYSYDQGDRVWSLGIGALMTLLNKNRGLIAEARALREVEAAQFETLQAKIVGEVAQTKARYYAALDELDKARAIRAAQLERTARIERQYDAGFADRLELTTTRLENLLAMQSLVNVEYKAQRAANALEDAIQQPLQDPLSMPANLDQVVERQP
ncbi:MAG TPA: TolC family protein [Methylophilaceae bacterium]|nr:TolC family protein [Methylophilaceae bacterium]